MGSLPSESGSLAATGKPAGGLQGSVLRCHRMGTRTGGNHSQLPMDSLELDTTAKLHRQTLPKSKVYSYLGHFIRISKDFLYLKTH